MKYLIIITLFDGFPGELWDLAKGNFQMLANLEEKSNNNDDSEHEKEEKSVIQEYKKDLVVAYMFRYTDTNSTYSITYDEVLKQLDDLLGSGNFVPDGNVYIVTHEEITNIYDLKNLEKFNYAIRKFSHSDQDPLFPKLKKFVCKPTSENFESCCEGVKKNDKINLKQLVQHKLNRILLPILLDLQGLEASSYNREYWLEIVNDYSNRSESLSNSFDNLIEKLKTDYYKLTRSSAESKEELVTCLTRYKIEAPLLEELTDSKKIDKIQESELKTKSDQVFKWADNVMQKIDLL